MAIVHIQHHVRDFDGWKRAFDSDPVDRRASGVRRYQVHRSVANPNLVMIDLELEGVAEAEKLLEKLRRLWAGPAAEVMQDPEAWVVETVESTSL